MKIVTIVGARPQFIKAGSVSREIIKQQGVKEVIVHTGQHYDVNMSDVFFEEMRIPKPNYFLGVGGGSHGAMTGQMIEKIEEVVLKEQPDWIIVYGDTNSTLAGAIVASKLHVKLAHIEAGLRSYNMRMPEEVNRILTDRVSQILFCPTDAAVKNLGNEGFNSFDCKIIKSGDVMQDGALYYRRFARKPPIEIKKDFILSTIHRAENTDDVNRLRQIFTALEVVAEKEQVILPLHPRTRKKLNLINYTPSRGINIIDPVGYLEMVWLIDNSKLVMTDSGGLQKEAFFFKKPCITLRDETEWVELVENRFNVLAGATKNRIIEVYRNMHVLFSNNYGLNLYGQGRASEIIVKELLNF